MNPIPIFNLQNNNIKLRLTPLMGCHWLSLQIKKRKRWLHVLTPAPNLKALRADPFNFGLYLMAPWCNRLAGAAFKWSGRRYQLQPNFPDGSAIHGDVGRHSWTVLTQKKAHFLAELESRQIIDFNYPFPVLIRHEIKLIDSSLTISLAIKNKDVKQIPVGAGFHPFFRRWLDPQKKDALHVALPFDGVYPEAGPYPKKKCQPVNEVFSEPFPWDFSKQSLDHTFTHVKRGRSVCLSYPQSGLQINMKSSSSLPYLFIYSPKVHMQKPAEFSCLEPMSMIPNGFAELEQRKKNGVTWLNPGKWLKTELKLSFSYRL